jgi:hypothetical protein
MGQVYVDDVLLEKVKAAFGSKAGDPNYNPEYDVNQDGVIDIKDIAFFASNYGKIVQLPQGLAISGALGLLLLLALFFMVK